ncbi:MAG TPA: hypothetical protein VKR21_03880 [Solirubrobacteraceae bacterium]|nr:hypothetical protein [Solirubrobacteraceae bacterium]
MHTAAQWARLALVEGPVEVVLEMEPTGSTIRGRIWIANEPPAGFFGWLELIDRLDRAAGTHATAGPGIPDHPKGVGT